MKSPRQLADQLGRLWQRAAWRELHFLDNPQVWPLRLPIGEPSAACFRAAGSELRQHLQQWRQLAEQGPGTVEWKPRQYRSGATPLEIPVVWVLWPSDCAQAFERCAGPPGGQAGADYRALTAVLGQVDARFHRVLLRRLNLWRGIAAHEVVTAARMVLQLEPGCADGRPLRALAVAGNDSKFFERHARLLTALLDERFQGEAGRQGLSTFLGAAQEGEHWLLAVPLADGLLPFRRQRVPVSELLVAPLPAGRILLVENERCLHQLPSTMPDTIALLGAGLDLGWLCAPWLRCRDVAYWGDMDTWGMAMLSMARSHLPQLRALLMDIATFSKHQPLAVLEPVHADTALRGALLPEELAFDQWLRTQDAGRIEQEFLPVADVQSALGRWLVGHH